MVALSATAVTAATMGAGAPLLVTTLAAAGTGAVAKAGTEGLVKGASYSNEEMATDAVAGAVEGATAAIGAHAGKALAHKAAERTVAAARVEASTAVTNLARNSQTLFVVRSRGLLIPLIPNHNAQVV